MKKYDALTITAAADEGYFVMEAASEATRGMYYPVLYAGDLGSCIRWMEARMRRAEELAT
jgi:hypothetical protein